VPPGEQGSYARKKTDRFEDPRDKRVTGESGSLANEPCDPVGQADWGREELVRAILAANLLHQLDKPTGGKTKLVEQNRIVLIWCQEQFFYSRAKPLAVKKLVLTRLCFAQFLF